MKNIRFLFSISIYSIADYNFCLIFVGYIIGEQTAGAPTQNSIGTKLGYNICIICRWLFSCQSVTLKIYFICVCEYGKYENEVNWIVCSK